MKLYKFRPLSSQLDLDRAKQILETGHFWCSRFSELNDPMEGAFTTLENANVVQIIDSIYGEKNKFKICSFSGSKGFENPSMWGYYANGFKGMGIEIEVEQEKSIEKVDYSEQIGHLNVSTNNISIRELLKTKLLSWKHEDEFRFLIRTESNYHEIGKITAAYFGAPYNSFDNSEEIINKSEILKDYEKRINQLKKIAIGKGIRAFSVEVIDNKVVPIGKSNPIPCKPSNEHGIFCSLSKKEVRKRGNEPR